MRDQITISSPSLARSLEFQIQQATKEFLADETKKDEFVSAMLVDVFKKMADQNLGFQSDVGKAVKDKLIKDIVQDPRFEETKDMFFQKLQTFDQSAIIMLLINKMLQQPIGEVR